MAALQTRSISAAEVELAETNLGTLPARRVSRGPGRPARRAARQHLDDALASLPGRLALAAGLAARPD